MQRYVLSVNEGADTALANSVLSMLKNMPIFELTEQPESIGNKRCPVYGCAKGQMWIAEDFDEPLEELREYME
ncbi:MAG: DUF2281 domain-containing protein [Oscillospiraceae bacterium]|nr:DUF2281 domain-containing protein [Oscillospiraceae bacterium]